VNDARVRQETVELIDFNNPVVAAPAPAGEAEAEHDEGKKRMKKSKAY